MSGRHQPRLRRLPMAVVNLEETNIPPKVLELVPETMASIYKIMPVSLKDGVLISTYPRSSRKSLMRSIP